MTKQDISDKWIVVTSKGERIAWGASKYMLSHFINKPKLQFDKTFKIEIMTKQEVFAKQIKELYQDTKKGKRT